MTRTRTVYLSGEVQALQDAPIDAPLYILELRVRISKFTTFALGGYLLKLAIRVVSPMTQVFETVSCYSDLRGQMLQ